MTDQFAFFEDKCKRKAAIAAMSLGVLLLLPASLGFGGAIIMQEAFGQFNLPLLEQETEEENGGIVVEEEEETTTTTPTTPTTPAAPATTVQDLSTYLMADVNIDPVYGFIGSTLPTQGVVGNTLTPEDDSGYVVTGPFRVFANETLLRRLVAEMNVAAVDGSSFHNITIQEGDPHRFQVTEGNGTTAASSSIVSSVYLNGSPTPVINNVPMTISIRGQVLAIEGIDIDEARITDTGQRDILRILDGQSIYGTAPRT
jgi:cytoskeletal protein RodZ